jgi:hypothetical protein
VSTRLAAVHTMFMLMSLPACTAASLNEDLSADFTYYAKRALQQWQRTRAQEHTHCMYCC